MTKWLRAHGKVRMLAGRKVGPVPNRGSALRRWPLHTTPRSLPHVHGWAAGSGGAGQACSM